MNAWSSIKSKLTMIMVAALLLLTLLSLYELNAIHKSGQRLESLIASEVQAEVLALQANLEFKRQVQEWKNVLIRGADAGQMERYWRQFNESHDLVQVYVNQLIPLLSQYPELRAIAQQFLTDHANMKTAYGSGRQQFIDSRFDLSVGDKAVSGIDRAPSAALDELVDQLVAIVNSQSQNASAQMASAFSRAIVLLLIVLAIVGAGYYWYISRFISRPLTGVENSLSRLAVGDLTQAVSAVDSQDEIGSMSRAAIKLHQFLTTNVDTMKQTTSALIDSSNHMEDMARQLATQSQQQLHATEQVATAVQELTHSAAEVASNAQETSGITQSTTDNAKQGSLTVSAAKDKASSLVLELNNSASVIKELADNAGNVRSVLEVIRGIAEQTNLLALNAAIEAARAGEQGRGFAVVADEVRTLAQRTATSTEEIEKILEAVRNGAEKAVVAVEKGQTRSHETEEDINTANTALMEIADMVQQINTYNGQIATAANEQTEVAQGLANLIQQIHELSESNQGRVDNAKSIASELQQLVKDFEVQIGKFAL